MSGIEWTDVTWNPVTGCTKVSQGCKNCYAERVFPRVYSRDRVQFDAGNLSVDERPRRFTDVRLHPERLAAPLNWRKPRRVFVNSMSDLFHEEVPDEFIAAVFGVMAASMQHTFQILTKRPARMLDWFRRLGQRGLGPYIRGIRVDGDRTIPNLFAATARTEVVRGRTVRADHDPWMSVFNAAACVGTAPLPNVWLGVSVENQDTADERIPLLLDAPAAVRFVSYEPALGPLRLLGNGFARNLDWVIVGGESGPRARLCSVAWIERIIRQCRAAGTACFVKQLGSFPVWADAVSTPIASGRGKNGDPDFWPESLRVREWPLVVVVVGYAESGRDLAQVV